MTPSPQSQAVVDRLLRAEAVRAAETAIGPFNNDGVALLEVVLSGFDDLSGRKGDDQVRTLRAAFAKAVSPKHAEDLPAPARASAPLSNAGATVHATQAAGKAPDLPASYRLLALKCMSVRGVAPPGQPFEFRFDGKSTLIYGPNGSGKSSVMGAVAWVLTGRVITDCEAPEDTVTLYKLPKGKSKGQRLRDWPVIATLPEPSRCELASPDCWAEVELRSETTKRLLYLRRRQTSGTERLESSDDGQTWNICLDLAAFGIDTLDTRSMVEDCLPLLRGCDETFRNEVKRLEQIRHHRRRGASVVPTSIIQFHCDELPVTWAAPWAMKTIGRAAAKSAPWAVELEDALSAASIAPGAAVLVASHTLEPVAMRGQWLLLADEAAYPADGDLVAVSDALGNRYVRRIWSDGSRWVLQAINPVEPIASVVCSKNASAVRRIVGVIYEPLTIPSAGTGKTIEWEPSPAFDVRKTFDNLLAVVVEGTSLDPIARKGQRVLVADHFTPTKPPGPGSLAVLETTRAEIGVVIKRVFVDSGTWTLVSPNPVDALVPIQLPVGEVRRWWPVHGVLFEASEEN